MLLATSNRGASQRGTFWTGRRPPRASNAPNRQLRLKSFTSDASQVLERPRRRAILPACKEAAGPPSGQTDESSDYGWPCPPDRPIAQSVAALVQSPSRIDLALNGLFRRNVSF